MHGKFGISNFMKYKFYEMKIYLVKRKQYYDCKFKTIFDILASTTIYFITLLLILKCKASSEIRFAKKRHTYLRIALAFGPT